MEVLIALATSYFNKRLSAYMGEAKTSIEITFPANQTAEGKHHHTQQRKPTKEKTQKI